MENLFTQKETSDLSNDNPFEKMFGSMNLDPSNINNLPLGSLAKVYSIFSLTATAAFAGKVQGVVVHAKRYISLLIFLKRLILDLFFKSLNCATIDVSFIFL